MLELIILTYVVQVFTSEWLRNEDGQLCKAAAKQLLNYLNDPRYLNASPENKEKILREIRISQIATHEIIMDLYLLEFQNNPVEGYDAVTFLGELGQRCNFMKLSEDLVIQHNGNVQKLHDIWANLMNVGKQKASQKTIQNKTMKDFLDAEELKKFSRENSNVRGVGIA